MFSDEHVNASIARTETINVTATTAAECQHLVRERYPDANGARYSSESSDGDSCWAEFGMTGTNSNVNWQSCLFAAG
eukprot:COSAG04_NODE_25919_length_302_cov_0.251232_1_plen_76_part_10